MLMRLGIPKLSSFNENMRFLCNKSKKQLFLPACSKQNKTEQENDGLFSGCAYSTQIDSSLACIQKHQ
jgi:hypothetical protein